MRMRCFEGEMRQFKVELSRRLETCGARVKHEYEDNCGGKFSGEYEGELKDGLPDGMGRWVKENGKMKVEGEWREGRLNGKAVHTESSGRSECEKREGKLEGKWIWYGSMGTREEAEMQDG